MLKWVPSVQYHQNDEIKIQDKRSDTAFGVKKNKRRWLVSHYVSQYWEYMGESFEYFFPE
jgi:hypothetical protein